MPNPISPYAVTLRAPRGGWPHSIAAGRIDGTLRALSAIDKSLQPWHFANAAGSENLWEFLFETRPNRDDRPFITFRDHEIRLELPQQIKSLQRLATFENLERILRTLVEIWRPAAAFVAPADWPTMRLLQTAKCVYNIGWITLVPASASQIRPLLPDMRVEAFDERRCLIYAVHARYTKRNREHNAVVERVAAVLDAAGILSEPRALRVDAYLRAVGDWPDG